MKSKGTSLTEIILSIALISMVMIFAFNILVDLKSENKISTTNGVSSLERSSYTRIIQNDLINNKLTGIKACDEGELCFDLKYENAQKRFKVENDSVIYDDEKWEIESEFKKEKVQFIYKLATNDEELLLNSNANNYYLLKIIISDKEEIDSNRKIDPEITNLGTGRLDIDCKEIKEKLTGAAYVECDGFEFESEEEIEDPTPHTVKVHLGPEWSANVNSGTANSKTYSTKTIRSYFSNVTIKAGNLTKTYNNVNNQIVTLPNVPKGVQVTITTTPSFANGDNLGYVYSEDGNKRTIQTYTASVKYNQQSNGTSSELSGTQSGNQFTFRMPGNDVDVWDNLIVNKSDTKKQKWYFEQVDEWAVSFNPMCVIGNSGEGPTLCWSMGRAGYSCSQLTKLAGKGWQTFTDKEHCGENGSCTRIIVSANVTDGGKKYEWKIECPNSRCACAENGHGEQLRTKEWTGTNDSKYVGYKIEKWIDDND